MKMNGVVFLATALAGLSVCAVEVDVNVSGAEKTPVAIRVANSAYANCLGRNLELTGLFKVAQSGAITVSGTAGGVVTASGQGKVATGNAPVTDAASARMAARKMADAIVETFGKQKGFACDRIAFINRVSPRSSELCMCYPDGMDIRQLTKDGKASVGPRWKNKQSLYYTGFLGAGPQVFELDVGTGKRAMRWSFKGLTTGAVVSPDGSQVALVLSFQGNPELYVLRGSNLHRLTNTRNASEGCPSWSPDGRQIVYVSDETRHPQLHIVDVATCKSRRLTSKGSQNVEPDWGPDGRITYIQKAGGSFVTVIDPAIGQSSEKRVTQAGNWSHPSWSRDKRHLVASRDKALFLVDTASKEEGGEDPRVLFTAGGCWMDPSWSK